MSGFLPELTGLGFLSPGKMIDRLRAVLVTTAPEVITFGGATVGVCGVDEGAAFVTCGIEFNVDEVLATGGGVPPDCRLDDDDEYCCM